MAEPIQTQQIVSLKEARDQGLVRYFTGKPCKWGHVAERRTNGCACVVCADIRHRKHRQTVEYKAQIRERCRQWRENNRERRRDGQRRYRKGEKTPRVRKLVNPIEYLLRRDGQWIPRYHKSLERKAGRPRPDVCEICGEQSKKRLCFDHCHQSGQFRGWLCYPCNTALGLVKDSPKRLKALLKYLEKHNGKNHNRRKKQTEGESIRPSGPTQISFRFEG